MPPAPVVKSASPHLQGRTDLAVSSSDPSLSPQPLATLSPVAVDKVSPSRLLTTYYLVAYLAFPYHTMLPHVASAPGEDRSSLAHRIRRLCAG